MKMFLLRSHGIACMDCGQSAMVIFRADNETEARAMAVRSNSHGSTTDIDWKDPEQATCTEFPLLDGPKGIVVGSWLDQVQPG